MRTLGPILLALLFVAGCKDNPPAVPVDTQSDGAIVFSIDKATAPSAVHTVSAKLTRPGHTPVEKSINIVSDSLATMLFQEIAIGTWHVRVDARDALGVLLYTGETDVVVIENSTSIVNLTLTPVPTGVGNIKINITWGSPLLNVVDYTNNPVLSRTGGNVDWGGIGQPRLFYDNGLYRMYYLNYSFPSPVSYAESQDGITWTRPDSLPIILAGVSGKWDDGGTGPGPVFKVGEQYFMLYQGYDAPTKHFKVGLAISSNGRHWEKAAQPILMDSLLWEYNIVACDVEKIDGKYYLYYSAGGKIGLAISTDGLTWVRHSSNAILQPTETWEAGNVSFPSVYKDGDLYKMVYMNNTSSYSGINFGMATSTDGITWLKHSTNPIFTRQKTAGFWAGGGIVYPYAIRVNNQTRIYYTGVLSNTGEWKIGFATIQ